MPLQPSSSYNSDDFDWDLAISQLPLPSPAPAPAPAVTRPSPSKINVAALLRDRKSSQSPQLSVGKVKLAPARRAAPYPTIEERVDAKEEKGLGNHLASYSRSEVAAKAIRSHAAPLSSFGFSGVASSSTSPAPAIEKPLSRQKYREMKAKGKTAGGKDVAKKMEAWGVAEEMKGKSMDEVNKYLLSTLGKESNPITNSDLYSRTSHVISCASGHQVSNRGVSKEGPPEASYIKLRNQKLADQFTATTSLSQVPALSSSSSAQPDEVSWSQKPKGMIGTGPAFDDWASKKAMEEGPGRMGKVGVGQLESRIFSGCSMYINGYTGPKVSDLELKRIVAVNGGIVSYHLTGATTHILLTSNLSGSKSQKYLDMCTGNRGIRRKVVHVDWVLDSIKQGRKLSEREYGVVVNQAQPTLFNSMTFSKSSKEDGEEKMGKEKGKGVGGSGKRGVAG